MPIRQITKPSAEEKQAAVNAQAPSTVRGTKLRPPQKDASANLNNGFITMKEAHIDGTRNEFIKPVQLFAEDGDGVSMPFGIHGARLVPNTLKPGTFNVLFTISIWGEGDKHSMTLPQDASRDEWVAYFATNTRPIGPVELHKIPNANPKLNDYLAIQHCETVIPF